MTGRCAMACDASAPSASATLKMKIHKACLARLFEVNDAVLDAEEIFELQKLDVGR